MTPVVKLLRLMDGQKPAMGKIYDRMFIIGQKISESSVSWKDQAAKIHAIRWEWSRSGTTPMATGMCIRTPDSRTFIFFIHLYSSLLSP